MYSAMLMETHSFIGVYAHKQTVYNFAYSKWVRIYTRDFSIQFLYETQQIRTQQLRSGTDVDQQSDKTGAAVSSFWGRRAPGHFVL